ncbi:Protein transport protein SEC13 [Entamoeba marina]
MRFDHYGTKLACASNDNTITIFDTTKEEPTLIATLKGHSAPVWRVQWSHPRFGPVLASCSYDKTVMIWREITLNEYEVVHTHKLHTKSVNSISFLPSTNGLRLACGSSDGRVSILEYQEQTKTWKSTEFLAHASGTNCVSCVSIDNVNCIATGGCDGIVKIHNFENGKWKCVKEFGEHKDWVRDVSFGIKNGKVFLASCGQDGNVIIYEGYGTDTKVINKLPNLKEICWRVNFDGSGEFLGVSCADNTVSIWKNNGNQFERVE